jgi:hypothetical protein
MFGDFKPALAWHIAATQHILKERNHIRRLFRPAKCDQKDGIVFRAVEPIHRSSAT